MLSDCTIEHLKSVLLPFDQLSRLTKKTNNESAGSCPQCGGVDRFYVRDGKAFCRQCKPKGGDIVDWHCWIEDTDLAGLLKKYGLSGNGSRPLAERWDRAKKTDPDQHHLSYLRERKIEGIFEYLKKHQMIGFEKGALVFPGRDASGNLIGLQTKPIYRGGKAKFAKGSAGRSMLYSLAGDDPGEPTVITEAVIDAISAKLATGFSAVATYSASTIDKLKGLNLDDPVLFFDSDQAGSGATKKALEVLPHARVVDWSLAPGFKDTNDLLKADRGNLIHRMITEAKPLVGLAKDKPRFEFIHNADILVGLQPIEWRIEGVLVENSFYYDFGDSGSYKTFLAIDRLMCIAAGIDYHGHPVRQGTVFYIAGEGQQGLGRRLAAWHIEHKTRAADVPFFVAKVPTQLMDPAAVEEVKRAVDFMAKEYGQPAVIHIDTLARNFGDGDENATKDMNRVITNLDAAFGNSICRGLTHHTGHANKDRARGSIALYGAADSVFRVSVTPGRQVLVECAKTKDAPKAPAMLFNIGTTLLLIGDEPDQSCTLSLAAEGDEALEAKGGVVDTCKASGNMRKALDLLDEMYAEYEANLKKNGRENAVPRVAISDWRTACLDKKIYKRPDHFNRAVDRMAERQLLYLDEGGRYVYSVSTYCKYIESPSKWSETE